MHSLNIICAKNGYIVTPEEGHPHMASPQPFVFESFESLTAWLDKNLDKHTAPTPPTQPA